MALARPAAALSPPVTEFTPPSMPGNSIGQIAAGPDGNLWYTETLLRQIGRITPAGVITEFAVPDDRTAGLPNNRVNAIAAGPDGNLWFTESAVSLPIRGPRLNTPTSRIGRITPEGIITEFPVTSPQREIAAITAGPDGNLWFTSGDVIGRITTAGVVTEFQLPAPPPPNFTQPSFPLRTGAITTGSDGNLWFVTAVGIGRITPGGIITIFPFRFETREFFVPGGIVLGPDGNVWFLGRAALVGRVTPDGQITEFQLPPTTQLAGLITDDGVIEFPVRTVSEPSGITTGADGNLWLTLGSNRIARITATGVITEFPPFSRRMSPRGITAGPDGNLWFIIQLASGGSGLARLPPLVPHEFFVTALYADVLDRTPSSQEAATWMEFLRSTGAPGPGAAVRAFLDAPENLSRRLTVASYIRLLYAVVLARVATQEEVGSWVPIVVGRLTSLVPAFVSSAEFQAVRASTPLEVLVTRFYQHILGRAPSAPELSPWLAFLSATGDFTGTIVAFFSSEEFASISWSRLGHVATLYRALLGREPDAEALAGWVAFLGARLGEIEEVFVASPEAQAQLRAVVP